MAGYSGTRVSPRWPRPSCRFCPFFFLFFSLCIYPSNRTNNHSKLPPSTGTSRITRLAHRRSPQSPNSPFCRLCSPIRGRKAAARLVSFPQRRHPRPTGTADLTGGGGARCPLYPPCAFHPSIPDGLLQAPPPLPVLRIVLAAAAQTVHSTWTDDTNTEAVWDAAISTHHIHNKNLEKKKCSTFFSPWCVVLREFRYFAHTHTAARHRL